MNENFEALMTKENPLCSEPDHQLLRLHAEQIIIEVMGHMNTTGEKYLSVYDDNNIYLGSITLEDILKFLEHEQDKNLYHYKLHYTVETLLVLKQGILNHLFIDDNSTTHRNSQLD